MMACSHPAITNGYSVVAYNLAKHIANKKDIDLIYWGFQKFQDNPEHSKLRKLPPHVTVVDAWANENPKQMGFGFDQIAAYVDQEKPDVIMIYNDFVVVSNILEKLKGCAHKDFKTVIYIDQVYLTQKKEYIKRLNDQADFVIAFTPYWEQIIKDQGMVKPSDYLQHGFDPMRNYPVPKKLARLHFGLKQDDFIVINLNRNQIRKRLDIMMMAWAEFVSRHLEDPVKLLIATHPTQGSWNLIEIYEHELRLRGIKIEEGMKHVILIDNPQQLNDDDVNTLLNTADVGLNTTMGAGFELTNFEHGAIGYPQVAPLIGGIRDFFDESCAKVVKPSFNFYTDTSTDGCPGKTEICDPKHFADAIEEYYKDAELRKKHGSMCRERILKNYKWSDLGEKLYKIVKKVYGKDTIEEKEVVVTESDKISLDDIEALEKNLDIKTIKPEPEPDTKKPEPEPETKEPETKKPEPKKTEATNITDKRKNDIKERLRQKLEKKKEMAELAELLKMKKQLDAGKN